MSIAPETLDGICNVFWIEVILRCRSWMGIRALDQYSADQATWRGLGFWQDK